MNERIKSSIIWALACALTAMGIVYLVHPKPLWMYAMLGVFGLAVGPMIAALGWAGADGLADEVVRQKALHEEKAKQK